MNTSTTTTTTTTTEFQMYDVAKKLTLWHTRTFRPILTHDELEPIMASAGFVPLPMSMTSARGGRGDVAWREYAFRGPEGRRSRGGGFLPRPRLPYPRIDGLHLLAYQAFFDALEFYLGAHQVPDLFHVRSMTIRAQDRVFHAAYRPMRDCDMDDEGIFVFRDGTLDHITKMVCNNSSKESGKDSSKSSNSLICLVPLDDLFPTQDVISLG